MEEDKGQAAKFSLRQNQKMTAWIFRSLEPVREIEAL